MNYYDVLGVRPNAGLEEIELAYKGRRSQYHPDRYSQADEETQAWATRKMQELNEAYATLTDRTARATHDRQTKDAAQPKQEERPQSGPPPMPPQPAPSTTPAAAESLAGYFSRKFGSGLGWSKVFVAPQIPLKKVSGALSTYAKGIAPSDILVLFDNTVFGSAKDGVVITSKEIRLRENPASSVARFNLEKIGRVQWERQRLYVDGREVAHLHIPENDSASFVIEEVNNYLSGRGSSNAAHAGYSSRASEKIRYTSTEALTKVHALAMTSVRQALDSSDLTGLIALIDRQMRHLFRLPPLLDVTLKSRECVGPDATTADTVEVVMTVFSLLHCYCLSNQTSAQKASLGSAFHEQFKYCFLYQEVFREAFQEVLSQEPELDDESLLAMTSMFIGSDGHAEMDLTIPRSEALIAVLEKSGINSLTGQALMAEFERQTQVWFASMVARVSSR